MRSLSFVFCLIGVFSLLWFSSPDVGANPIPAVYDGEFNNWSYDVLLESGEGTGSMIRQTSGGNPGAYLTVCTQSGWELAMWVLMWKNDFMWDPSTDGIIDSLTFLIDEVAIASAGDGQNIKLAVIQGGRTYLAPLSPWLTTSGTETSWGSLFIGSVTANDFVEVPPWPYNPTEKPDFSASGGPITLGFMVGVSSVLDVRCHGYDNYEVIVHTPWIGIEPNTWSRVKTLYR